MVMHPYTKYLERQKRYGPDKFRQLFGFRVKGQGVLMVRDTQCNGHAPTYQVSSVIDQS